MHRYGRDPWLRDVKYQYTYTLVSGVNCLAYPCCWQAGPLRVLLDKQLLLTSVGLNLMVCLLRDKCVLLYKQPDRER
jgi:hypothetical protein